MGNELTELAAVTLDFRDVVRNLKWREKWPLGDGLALKHELGDWLRADGAMIVGKTVAFDAGFVIFDLAGLATLREIVDRGRLIGSITETSLSGWRDFSAEVVDNAMPMQIEKL